MNWASRRKLIYVGLIMSVFIIAASVPAYLFLSKEPTCFDNKKNGDEYGVDCGGACELVCVENVQKLIVHWARAFRSAPGVYDIAASVQNTNVDVGAREIIYSFKLYDQNNILIVEKRGKTFINGNEQFIVFENGVRAGERVPKYVFLEFEPAVRWERVRLSDGIKPNISIKNQYVENLDSKPRLNANIVNSTAYPIENIYVTAVLYDINDNAIAVSSTYIENVSQKKEETIVFTWQEPFSSRPARISIIPRVDNFILKDNSTR